MLSLAGGKALAAAHLTLKEVAPTAAPTHPEVKKLVVDDTLVAMMGNGGLERRYEKWFMSPTPPNKATLRMPMSGMLKGMLRNPSDAGIQ